MTITELYALVPSIQCKGLCADNCSIIPMTAVEWQHLARPDAAHIDEEGGRVVMTDAHRLCPLLHKGRCTVHSRRPLICRLFGVVEGMRCEHGCVPERVLSTTEAQFLLSQVRDGKVEL